MTPQISNGSYPSLAITDRSGWAEADFDLERIIGDPHIQILLLSGVPGDCL